MNIVKKILNIELFFYFDIFDITLDNSPAWNWRYFNLCILNICGRSLFKFVIEIEKPYILIKLNILFLRFFKNFVIKKQVKND